MDRKFGRLSLLFALCLAISAFSACGGTGVPSGESDVSQPTGSVSLPSDTADSTDGPTGTDSSETTDSSGTSDSSASDSSDSSDESEEPGEPDAPGRILVFGKADESAALLSLLAESGKYDAERADIADAAEYGTAEALGAYDEIILNNVAVREMPDGFQEILCSYVYDLGGGLLTAGGRDERGEPHAYNRDDMTGTVYEEILPVQAVNFEPPAGIVFVLDNSGSMGASGADGKSALDRAKEGISACLDALPAGDCVSVVTSDGTTAAPLTNLGRAGGADVIKTVMNGIGFGGGTQIYAGLSEAAELLLSAEGVYARHVVLLTDGEIPDAAACVGLAEKYYRENGITFSAVGLGASSFYSETLEMFAESGGGKFYAAKTEDLFFLLFDDLHSPELREFEYEPFFPEISDPLSPLFESINFTQEGDRVLMTAQLGGFFGARAKEGSEVVLSGPFGVPVYACRDFGAGKTGSFLCDLSGDWSAEFMADEGCRKFLLNAVGALIS
ncbi:MAG TPA: VWA domain-containing protein [Candidatus Scatosoma pullicola]|nr:VWA domain-containing protein [Candidatus Scatosoma pullicola]